MCFVLWPQGLGSPVKYVQLCSVNRQEFSLLRLDGLVVFFVNGSLPTGCFASRHYEFILPANLFSKSVVSVWPLALAEFCTTA